jgi:hypothetical protein
MELHAPRGVSGQEVSMPTIAFCVPISSGKTDVFRAAQRRFVVERRPEFQASRRRLGITAERGYLQQSPAGDLAVVVIDVADPLRFFTGAATSTEPLDVDFRSYLSSVFGLDLTRGPAAPPSEQVFDWTSDAR